MSLAARLNRLTPALNGKQRALLVIRAHLDDREPDREWLDMPSEQRREYDYYVALLYTSNTTLGVLLKGLTWIVDALEGDLQQYAMLGQASRTCRPLRATRAMSCCKAVVPPASTSSTSARRGISAMTTEVSLSPEIEAKINEAVAARFAEIIQTRVQAQAETKPASKRRIRRLAIVASKGTLDMAYPPLILASTATAMGWEVAVFFTFYGLDIITKKKTHHLQVPSLANPAMPVPNIIGAIPGMTAMATRMMKGWMSKANMPELDELIAVCRDGGARLIACSTTMGVMRVDAADILDGLEIGAAAAFLDFAADADVSLFI
jgi:peroxiredoxin family protein